MENSKIICIGDIHGELGKLKSLFEKLSFDKEDTIVFLGDYIDRGLDSKGAIDFILSLKDKCNLVTLKGNHEQFALDSLKFIEGDIRYQNMFRSWMLNGGQACLDSYSPNFFSEFAAIQKMFELHGHFFNNLQLTYETENFIFVHGFLAHELDADEQEEFQCLWGRYRDIWPHKSSKTVVCGHTPQKDGPKNDGFKICIDTGSFKPDGYITALVIDGPKSKFVTSKGVL